MSKSAEKQQKRFRRHNRIRAKVNGTAECPRLAVYRSNKFLYAQIIDDIKRVTLASADSRSVSGALGRGEKVGADIATKAKAAGITKVVFDRGGFLYTGVIKELADSARKAGLIF